MSGYIFIASDIRLKEINPTRFLKLTAREIKQLKYRPGKSLFSWIDAPDEMEILWQINEETDRLQVEYHESPLYVLDSYTMKPFIYQLGGNLNEHSTIKELHDYIVEEVIEGISIELWSIWIGNEKPDVVKKTVKIDEFTNEHIQMIHRPDYCCTVIK